ncbi:conserved hypothetical protein [Ricinus communis]|uniref:Uncharacterized protein n=1 Tax=Ricinus communis TaxID=3988 RepID=B9TME3_RICCO|nr:conserved hypothetical protein [Ricinus communis]
MMKAPRILMMRVPNGNSTPTARAASHHAKTECTAESGPHKNNKIDHGNLPLCLLVIIRNIPDRRTQISGIAISAIENAGAKIRPPTRP